MKVLVSHLCNVNVRFSLKFWTKLWMFVDYPLALHLNVSVIIAVVLVPKSSHFLFF